METEQKARLTSFFKLVGHETRLKLLGLLANEAQTAATLAATLGEKEKVVLAHLRTLQKSQLVQTARQGNELHYLLNGARLKKLEEQVEGNQVVSDEEELLAAFVENGRLTRIPQSIEAQDIVLRWLAEKFEINQRYQMADVEAILQQHCRTTLSALRYLRDRRLLLTIKGIYWRPAPQGGAA
mgnify:CR=1 FL=1